MATFKVTRTWYVEADKAVETIEKTHNFDHDEVSSKKVYCREVTDLRKEEQVCSK
jgi:hypothetical protein